MKKLFPSYVRVPLLFAIVLVALEYFIDSGDRPAFVKYPMVALFLAVFLFLLVAIEIVVSAVDKVTYHLLTEEQKKQLEEAQTVSFVNSQWYQHWMSKLTRSKAVEQEADVMLDHDYDGIRELDNVLPPWWVYLFYVTIIFAGIYLVRYHFFGGENQAQEFETEVALAEEEMLKFKGNSPKETISLDQVTALTDPASLSKGQEIYKNVCAACHGPQGGGLVGPNLTDTHWLNGGGIKNVFKVIHDGSPRNPTMAAWGKTLDAKDVQKVASYVWSLQGTKPAGAKPAEGDVWKDDAAPTADASKPADSIPSAK